jgi:uncharacterized protein (TIRG00374 family)
MRIGQVYMHNASDPDPINDKGQAKSHQPPDHTAIATGSDETQSSRSNWSTLLRAIVSFSLLGVLLWKLDWREIDVIVNKISVRWLLIVPVLYFINTGVSTIKWRRFLSDFKIHEDFGYLFRTYLISSFLSTFLPSTIGGDGYRFITLSARRSQAKKEILSSIILDRAYGLLVLLIFHLGVAAFYWARIRTYQILFWSEIGIIIIVGLGIMLFSLFWNTKETILAIVRFKFLQKLLAKSFEVIALMGKPRLRAITIALIMSFIFILSSCLAWAIYYLSAGVKVEIGFVFYAATLSSLAGMLPISINGIGLIEMTQVAVIGLLGIQQDVIILVTLTSRLVNTLMTSSGGVLNLWDTIRIKRRSP